MRMCLIMNSGIMRIRLKIIVYGTLILIFFNFSFKNCSFIFYLIARKHDFELKYLINDCSEKNKRTFIMIKLSKLYLVEEYPKLITFTSLQLTNKNFDLIDLYRPIEKHRNDQYH